MRARIQRPNLKKYRRKSALFRYKPRKNLIQHLNTHGWRVYGLGKQILTWKDAKKVRGKLRQLLTDLIKTKHNSNYKTQQITLEGEKIQEYIYYLLGFVPATVIRLQKMLGLVN